MHILTFDIEDWFHILDNPQTKNASQWSDFESRIERNMDTLFHILSEKKVNATFFVVGWMAEKYPEQIRRIIDRGYHIGSHSHLHQLVYTMSPNEFKTDLHRSVDTIQQVTGRKVNAYRAPGFSINSLTPWAFEAMIENGIEIDCSVFPSSRAHGGFPEFGLAVPSIIEINGMKLKEFPINTSNFLGKDLIFSGGGYFRLFPYWFIKNFSTSSNYIMSYFHPRDFDADQPMVPGLSFLRKLKSYYGLGNTERKLLKWMDDFSFIDIPTADVLINWDNQPIVKLY